MVKIDESEFVGAVQRRAARIAASAWAARRQGPGAGKAARNFLCAINLGRFNTASEAAFHRQLDEATDELTAALPLSSRKGACRESFSTSFFGTRSTQHI
jgi:hypothetical protein